MARSYAVTIAQGTVTTTANFCGIQQTVASPVTRGRIFEFIFGSSITPADYASKLSIMRLTTALSTGGNTSVAGVMIDAADGASQILGFTGNTGGATLSSVLLAVGVNMRATFRWVAAPTKELTIAATQYLGIGMVVQAQSTTYTPDATLLWEE